MKFDYLKDQMPKRDETREFDIYAFTINDKFPVLNVVSATVANKPYFAGLLKNAASRSRSASDESDQLRENDYSLYSRHVVTGWSNVVDEDGEPVPFTKANCEEFLRVLPEFLFDELRTFCGNASNFTEVVEIEARAKN